MDDVKYMNIASRKIPVSQRVLDMLVAIEEESKKQEIDTSPYRDKVTLMACYYRYCPDYVLTCLEPILEMAKNKISPAYAFELIEMYGKIAEKATRDAKESRNKRMAQESRVTATYEKRKLFAKIKQDYEKVKQEKSAISLPMLIEKYFPEAKDDDRLIENLRQQYYRVMRKETGVQSEQISKNDAVRQKFLEYYLLDNGGIIEENNGVLSTYNMRIKIVEELSMKKVKLLFVSLLTVVLSLLCLASCGVNGKYTLASIQVGSTTTTVEESESFVELKSDNAATVSITVNVPLVGEKTLQGEGSWKEGDEDKAYVITLDGIPYNVTIDGKVLTLSVFGIKLNLQK